MTCRKAVLQGAADVWDSRAPITGDDTDPFTPVLLLDRYVDLTPASVLDDVAGQFGDCGRNESLLAAGKPELSRERAPLLACGHDVDLGQHRDPEVVSHERAIGPRQR